VTIGVFRPVYSSIPPVNSPVLAMMTSAATTPRSVDSGPADTEPFDCVEYPPLPTRTGDVVPVGTSDTPAMPPSLPVKRHKSMSIGKQEREAFVNQLPTRSKLIIDQDFGKPSLDRCFQLEACLSLVLLPLYHSGFLTDDDQKMLARGSKHARTLIGLFDEYNLVDFRPLREYPVDWQEETDLNYNRLHMTTAAVLHYHGDLASVVRFIGGIHVGAHRDHKKVLKSLEGIVQDSIIRDLRRIWTSGVPNKCNAYSSQENFQAFRNYGNHASVSTDPAKTQAAFVKDNRRSFNLIMDMRLVPFLLNAHLTPQGMVNLSKPNKKDRPVFDSTFRPTPSSMAINDWTDKCNEPPLVFPTAFLGFLIHIYNLRI
jgi:hypothetical protein